MTDIPQQFRDFLTKHNHTYDGPLIINSPKKYERAACPNASPKNTNLSYYIRTGSDSRHYGYFTCFAGACGGISDKWAEEDATKGFNRLSPSELEEKLAELHEDQKISEGDRLAREENCSLTAQKYFDQAVTQNLELMPYVLDKKFIPYGLKKWGDTLYVPLRDVNGKLWNIERIYSNHKKRPIDGARVNGLFHLIGEINLHGTLYLAEGIATASIVFETLLEKVPTACCRNANNLLKVAKAIKQKYPNIKFKVAGDDDRFKLEKAKQKYRDEGKEVPRYLKNAGINAALKVKRQFKAEVTSPDFSILGDDEILLKREKSPSDFHDVFYGLLQRGSSRTAALDTVRQQLSNLKQDEDMITEPQDKTSTIEYQQLSEIEAKPIEWLWKGKIARGKYGVIAGHPGVGKSQLTANITGTVTTGGDWPDKKTCTKGSVIILSAEDGAADTIRPRCEAAGAILEYIFIIQSVNENNKGKLTAKKRQFNLESDLENLSLMIDEINDKYPDSKVVLIIVDPISAYLGKNDSNNNSVIRGLLAPVSDLAEKYNVAILGVSHFTKGQGKDAQALLRVCGSLAFIAAARFSFLVALDDDDKNKRLFIPLKNNLAKNEGGLSFNIEDWIKNKIETSRIVWTDETVNKTADEVMGHQQDTGEKSALEEACDFLRDLLANGPVFQKDIKQQAEQSAISEKTLYRAKTELKIISDKEKGARDKPWFWRFPEDETVVI